MGWGIVLLVGATKTLQEEDSSEFKSYRKYNNEE